MLNELLYRALKSRFHDVVVNKEGQAADLELIDDISMKWRVRQGCDSGEEYRIDCPYCHDHKKHLYISYLSYYRPTINGQLGVIGRLKAHCFLSGCMKKPENIFDLDRKLGFSMAEITETGEVCCDQVGEASSTATAPSFQLSSEPSLAGVKTWIPDWHVIDNDTDPSIIEYLNSRRVSETDVHWLHIGWGPIRSPRSKRYLNDGLPFVLFPIINNQRLVGVQARCPDKYLTEDQPKYYFHPGCRKQTLLFNLDEARRLGVGVVCEGIFDVLSVGLPGVCCFGHTPSTAQMRLLSTFERGLIFLPDTDVRPDLNTIRIAETCADKLKSTGQFDLGVYVVRLPSKDAGEMTRSQVWSVIRNNVALPMKEYLEARVIPKL